MSESAYLTYYQRNRDVILNRAILPLLKSKYSNLKRSS